MDALFPMEGAKRGAPRRGAVARYPAERRRMVKPIAASMTLVAAILVMGAYPILAAAPSRFQYRDSWAIETVGPGGPTKFIDRNGDGLLGVGDRVDMSRGHFTMINLQIIGPATFDLVDPTRPAVSHIDGIEKRFDVVGVDPASGALSLASRAFRIVHAWRDYNFLLGVPIC